MNPVIHHDGVGYYEARVNNVLLVERSVKLWESWYYDWGGKNPQYIINEFIDNEGIPYCEATEAWLLWSYESKVSPYWYEGRRRVVDPANLRPCFHALLLLAGMENEEAGPGIKVPRHIMQGERETKGFPHTSFHVSVEALCRDPWADPDPVAIWAESRALSLSVALGGATDLRITAPETDLAFQMALKRLGYFCRGYLGSPDPKPGEDHPLLDFEKILKLRSRLSLGFPDPLAPLHSIAPKRKPSK